MTTATWLRRSVASVVFRPPSAALLVALTVATLLPAPPDGGAALICERTKKSAAKVFLRAGQCKAKETAVFDTDDTSSGLASQGGRLDQHDQQLAAQDGRVTVIERQLGSTCPGDPARELLTTPAGDASGLLLLLGYLPSECRAYDDDPQTCAQKFELRRYGAAGCVHTLGKCLPCELELSLAGVCTNACVESPATCPNDPTRTTRIADCANILSQPACEQSWTLSPDFANRRQLFRGTSCYWAGSCRRCGAADVSNGACTNACLAPADLPRCRDATRTFGRCSEHDGNQPTCEARFESGPYGTLACWYDAGTCSECNPADEAAGHCTNPC